MTSLNWLAELIQKIPATFWGVLIGSFFSLSGVILSNRASERRLKSQFLHERDLRNRDRELALRKEVYLSVAEAIYAGLLVLGKFSNLEVPEDKLTEGYLDRAPAIAKVHIIAREETVKAIVSVARELTRSILQLTVKRVPLAMQRQHLILLDAQISKFGEDRDQWVELMKQHNLDGKIDDRRWGVIEGNFKFEQQRVSETVAQRAKAASKLYVQQLELAKECISESLRLAELIIPAVTLIRKELNIPTDSIAFEDLFQESIRIQTAALASFFDSAKGFNNANREDGVGT